MYRIYRGAALFLILPLVGCLPVIVPVPVPKVSTSARGKISNIDLTQVQRGAAYDEIENQLADIKIDCGTSRVFWGRWNTSNMSVVFTYGSTRLQSTHNVVMEFDGSGKLLLNTEVDDKRLLPVLSSAIRNAALPPLSVERDLVLYPQLFLPKYRVGVGKIRLTATELRFPDSRTGEELTVPVTALDSLTSSTWPYSNSYDARTLPGLIAVKVNFSTKGAVGKNVRFGMEPNDFWTMIRWFKQVKGS
jgi:hypothetical protein